MSSSDEIDFLPENAPVTATPALPPWKVLLVDDEPGVHAATRLALGGIHFRNREIEFISAYNSQEAINALREHGDIAVMFLDVVMETDDAGLKVARQLRAEGFNLVRVILRTGHPGYAPEREVIVNYDIHDYKEKSTLDFSKLFSCLISALRAYDDLVALEQHRRGLVSVLESVSWFDLRSLQRYLSRMLAELSSLANIDISQLLIAAQPGQRHRPVTNEPFSIVIDGLVDAPLKPAELQLIASSFATRAPQAKEGSGASFFVAAFDQELVLFTREGEALQQADQVLLEMFLNKVAQALDNHHTFTEILNERDSLVRGCANQGEPWGGHQPDELASIQQLARRTAARLQQRLDFPAEIDDWFVFSIGTASGFHDLGVQALPHRLFEQPDPLSEAERATLQQHVNQGVELLRGHLGALTGSRLFAMAEKVILQHHERIDGSGYPQGLSGDEIDLAAKIVAVVDTYVAMTSPRPYRPAHSTGAAQAFLLEGRDRFFDRRVTDAFLEVISEPI